MEPKDSGNSPKVPIGVNRKESPSRRTKMALHSEVQAEEGQQEQGEEAESRGGQDPPTCDVDL